MLIEMLQVMVRLVGTIIVLIGIILIYDARIITKKFFGFGDQNEATKRLKDFRVYDCYGRWINCIFCVKLLDKRNKNMLR